METLDFNKILNREDKATAIKEILTNFELNKNNLLFKKFQEGNRYQKRDTGSVKMN